MYTADLQTCRSTLSVLQDLVNDFDLDTAQYDEAATASPHQSSNSVAAAADCTDLQDLIDAVLIYSAVDQQAQDLLSLPNVPEDDITSSSFENNISTATEAAALALRQMLNGPNLVYDSQQQRTSFETVASSFVPPSFDESCRPSYETQRTSFDSADYKCTDAVSHSNRSSFQHYMDIGRPSVR